MRNEDISEEIDENDENDDEPATELTSTTGSHGSKKFNPLYLISKWKEPNTLTDRLSVASSNTRYWVWKVYSENVQ